MIITIIINTVVILYALYFLLDHYPMRKFRGRKWVPLDCCHFMSES